MLKIPYLGRPTILLQKRLLKILAKHQIKLRVVYQTFRVGSYFSLKDRTDDMLAGSLVYKFQCLGDPDKAYIGKTKRYLHKRVTEHGRPGSAVYTHTESCSQCNEARETKTLRRAFTTVHRDSSDFHIQILEALYIASERPCLNKQLAGEGRSFMLNVF